MAVQTALFILSLVSSGVQYSENKKAAAEAKEARRAESAGQSIEASKRLRSEIRKARVRRAQILQSAETTGTGGSSAAIGAQSSIASRLAGAQAGLGGSEKLSTGISRNLQSAADAQFRGQLAGGFSDLFSQASQNKDFTSMLDEAFS